MQLRDVPTDIQTLATDISAAIQASTRPNAPAFTGNLTGIPPAAVVPTGAILLAAGLLFIWLKSRR